MVELLIEELFNKIVMNVQLSQLWKVLHSGLIYYFFYS